MKSGRAPEPGFSGPQDPYRGGRSSLPARARRLRPEIPAALQPSRRELRRASRRVARAASTRPGALSAEHRLVQRISFGANLAELAAAEDLGYQGYLERQLDYRSIDDSELEGALAAALPTLAMSPAEVLERFETGDRARPVLELVVAALYRALYSPRQLFERIVEFWSDHFNIHLFSEFGFALKPTDDREVVRVHALGSFPELLRASARSPAMLSYLTNDSNIKEHPNENYARELMELHTLGADRGYTQEDVVEVARCFTGWTFRLRGAGAENGRFVFDPRRHDNGAKRVLGQRIPAGGGIQDGERVLEILASHRNTSEFLAQKLLRHFWGYEPKRKAVRAVARAYRSSGGDIPSVLREVLKKRRMAKGRPKLKRPFHLMVSAARALFAEVGNPGYLVGQLLVAGHLPFNWAPPNGYPDSQAYWSGFVLPRWNFATTFLNKKARSGIRVDLPFLDPDLGPRRIAREIDRYLLGGEMGEASRGALVEFLEGGALDNKRIRDAIGLGVASPEFQEY